MCEVEHLLPYMTDQTNCKGFCLHNIHTYSAIMKPNHQRSLQTLPFSKINAFEFSYVQELKKSFHKGFFC